MVQDISKLDDAQKAKLVEARWTSSSELWDIVKKTYELNTGIYENRATWLQYIPVIRRQYRVQANRIFPNMEAVINSLIANPPGLNMLPSRKGTVAQDFARKLESYFRKKFNDLNTKETVRKGLRNLYFARLLAIKPFWNPLINDFDFRAVDPRNIRVGKYASKEQDSEFYIEEIEDNLCAVVERFPAKKKELMDKYGFVGEAGESDMYIQNPDIKYKEAWIGDSVIFKADNLILDTIKNPYWDWQGILLSEEEIGQLEGTIEVPAVEGDARRTLIQNAKLEQETRKASQVSLDASQTAPEGQTDPMATPANDVPVYKQYFFNYFDSPRKPIIFATIFNNENSPIGRTDMITLAAELQKGIDKRKMDIDENCELANGIIKVDAEVMGKADAQRIRFQTRGIIWGKGVKEGVTRETGGTLPQMVFDDMIDSRNEIDNIMAASSAFRGERQGQETKAGRLALIQQSYLRLNELVQVTDYVAKEMFDWAMQLAKTRYTEYHSAETVDKEGDREVIELIQDDIEIGNKVTIIAGKTLPVDDEFKFEQAQNDFEKGALGLTDYLEISNYENAKEVAKNAVTYQLNKPVAVGMSPEEVEQIAPAQKEEKPPSVSIGYADLPPDAQVQLLAQIGITADPAILVGERMRDEAVQKEERESKAEAMKVKAEAKPVTEE